MDYSSDQFIHEVNPEGAFRSVNTKYVEQQQYNRGPYNMLPNVNQPPVYVLPIEKRLESNPAPYPYPNHSPLDAMAKTCENGIVINGEVLDQQTIIMWIFLLLLFIVVAQMYMQIRHMKKRYNNNYSNNNEYNV